MTDTFRPESEPDITIYYELNTNNGRRKWWIHSETLEFDEEIVVLARLFGLNRGTIRGRLDSMVDGRLLPDNLFKEIPHARRNLRRKSEESYEKQKEYDRERSLSPRTVPSDGWQIETGWPVPKHIKELKQ